MPRKASARSSKDRSYWRGRIRSAAFREALIDTLAAEIRRLSTTRVRDLVDAGEIRRLIAERPPPLVDHKALADLIVQITGVITRQLAARNSSILELLDEQMAARIEAILDEDLVLSEAMEDFVRRIMQQEFVEQLFTDIIYSSIVSFNQRVNPLFGRMTIMALEDQIKGFIRFFMPMAQKQAVAFATSRKNQAVFFDFTRAILRNVLNQPISRLLSTLSAKQRKKAESLIRHAVGDDSVNALLRDTALAVWDEVYEKIGPRKVGELLHLSANARWLAERGASVLVPVLARPEIARLAADEIGRAARSS